MSPKPDVASALQHGTLAAGGINASMSQTNHTTSGIEVQEHTLNRQELGFVSGVFEALANSTLTEAEFRLLLAQVTDPEK
jgi:hypothetical protein